MVWTILNITLSPKYLEFKISLEMKSKFDLYYK